MISPRTRLLYQFRAAHAHHARVWDAYCRALLRPLPAGKRVWGLVDAAKRETMRTRERLIELASALRAIDAGFEYRLNERLSIAPVRESND